MSWKLLVYQDRVSISSGIQTRCYVFEFNTREAAQEARKFFNSKEGCYSIWVEDNSHGTD